MRTALFLLCLALADPARADDASAASVGTAAGAFLKTPPDARSVGMGQTGEAAAQDAAAAYWNPAGLASVGSFELSFTHALLFQGLFYDYLALALPTQTFLGQGRKAIETDRVLGAVGLGVQYLNSGPVSEVDNTGTATGNSFTPQDLAVTAAWGSSVGPLDLGASGKYVSSSLRDSASTFGLDLGGRLRFQAAGLRGALAASVHNLFGGLKFVNQTDALPVLLRTGLAISALPGWTVAGELDFPSDNGAAYGLGTEYRLELDDGWSAAGRLGYNSLTSSSQLESQSGFSIGGGLGYEGVFLDYAWLPYGLLGTTHRLSVTMKF